MNLRFRKFLGTLSRIVSPAYSYCKRCGISWKFVDGHTTIVNGTMGCFALCISCFDELTPQERLPFYREVFDNWIRL